MNWAQVYIRDRRIGFIASLSIHGVLFFIGGMIFVRTVSYNVQNIPQSTTVQLVQTVPQPQAMLEKAVKKSDLVKKQKVVVQKKVSQQVSVKANANYFQNPPPTYPDLAKQMGQQGLVLLSVDVDRYGNPVKVTVKQSSGYRMLDEAAQDAVRHWRFQPGRVGDMPVESTVTIPIRFRLQE